jgi:hypothetical protein
MKHHRQQHCWQQHLLHSLSIGLCTLIHFKSILILSLQGHRDPLTESSVAASSLLPLPQPDGWSSVSEGLWGGGGTLGFPLC